jgi:hypothetical protein
MFFVVTPFFTFDNSLLINQITMNKISKIAGAFALGVAAFSCEQDNITSRQPVDASPIFMKLDRLATEGRIATDAKYTVFSAEYLTSPESGEIGRTIYFNDLGNKQLDADFVPGLSLDGNDNISYYIDQNRPSNDLPVSVTSNAINRAMNTWENVTCSNIGLNRVPSNAEIKTGWVAAYLGLPGSFDYTADLVHAGWLPAPFFNAIAPQGASYILGVTFTITFTDENGNLVDSDNNGKADVAWREVYYNDAFNWKDGAHYDVETIALHESGHGLSQAHFGTAFADSGAGKLHFSPRAVMNAAYSGIQTTINQSDNAGHCANWAEWPNR